MPPALARPLTDPWIRRGLLVALVLRLGWLLLVPVVPESDSFAYDTLAQTLADHNVYGWQPDEPSSHWPPGTAFTYSVLYRVFGHVYWPIELLNLALGVGVVYLSACLALCWFDLSVARITTALLAVWPSLVMYTTVLASELPFISLMLLAMLVRATVSSRIVLSAVLVGVLTAAATLIRTEGLFLPLVWAMSCPPRQQISQRIMFGLLATTCLVLVVIPWAYRNSQLHGQTTFLVTSSGVNLWMGNNPDTEGGYMPPPELPELTYLEKDAHLGNEAVDYIVDNPGVFVLNALTKAVKMHSRETIAWHWTRSGLERVVGEQASLVLKWIAHLFWIAVCFGGVCGVFVCFRRQGWSHVFHPALLTWTYITAIHAVTIALQDRFHFPSNPFIAMYASTAALALLHVRTAREPT